MGNIWQPSCLLSTRQEQVPLRYGRLFQQVSTYPKGELINEMSGLISELFVCMGHLEVQLHAEFGRRYMYVYFCLQCWYTISGM